MVAKEAAKEAFENGFSAGEEQGRNEGISLGAQQKAVETAKNLLSIGLSQDQIASVTGLSPEEIEKL
jgi:predicted transposase/invertase (TIGR01784 family)